MRTLIAALKQFRTNVSLVIALLEAGDIDGALALLDTTESEYREALDTTRSAA